MKRNLILMFSFPVILAISLQTVPAQFNANRPKLLKIEKSNGNDTGNQAGTIQEDVQTNPNAPPDYNANLKVGDQAIAIDKSGDIRAVKILAKSGAAYKTAKLKEPDTIQWYSLNSVYPYYDTEVFDEAVFDNAGSINPYLSCYAKKHNIDEDKVKGEGFFGESNFSNADQARKELLVGQPKLAEIDGIFKSKIVNAPNNFMPYKENPAIIAEIVSQRSEYLKCAVAEVENKPDFRLSVFLDDIKNAQEEVDRYTPGDFLYLVSEGDHSAALFRAVSPKAREEWSKQWLKDEDSRQEFNEAWDVLAKAAAKKIPTYKPSVDRFKFSYPAGEKLLMDYFKNPSTLKIFRTGTDTAGWDIQKDSSNFPSYRYKDVRVYLRDSSDDFPYCKVVTARIKQDYAGGGTYNAKIYRSSASEEIVGCPQ